MSRCPFLHPRRTSKRRVLRRHDRELHRAGCGRDVAGAAQGDDRHDDQRQSKSEHAGGRPRQHASPEMTASAEWRSLRLLRRAAEQFLNLKARVADVTQPRLRILFQAAASATGEAPRASPLAERASRAPSS